jgi:hypothetical protein
MDEALVELLDRRDQPRRQRDALLAEMERTLVRSLETLARSRELTALVDEQLWRTAKQLEQYVSRRNTRGR